MSIIIEPSPAFPIPKTFVFNSTLIAHGYQTPGVLEILDLERLVQRGSIYEVLGKL